MDGTGIKQLVIREIRELAEKHSVCRVILFGSRARGDFRRTSDIDLAVEGGDFERFSLDVNEVTSTLLEYDIVVLTGLVGLYELCFEQAWKMMKEVLEDHGYEEGATGSPKIILKTAYKAGMIKNEDLWLRALQERNNVPHSYNQKIALEIVAQAKEKFYDMFCTLKKEIEEKWL